MSEPSARDLLLEHGALLEGHFELSSGRHSDRYLQCALALQHPRTAERLGTELAEAALEALQAPLAAVFSPALGGVIIGHEVGRALDRRACFTERVDGAMRIRRGFRVQPEESILLVEDVVTTGLSSREALAAIRDAGGAPMAVACIANRSGESRVDDLPLISLLDLEARSWAPVDCPLCATGDAAIKPGSRT